MVSKYSTHNRMEVSNVYRDSVLNPHTHSHSNLQYGSNTIIMNESVFIESLPKKNQEELALYIEFYRRFSTVL